jgi:hypothetical protein
MGSTTELLRRGAACEQPLVMSRSVPVVLGVGLDLDRDQKWLDHYRRAERIFELAGVMVETINPDELTQADRP